MEELLTLSTITCRQHMLPATARVPAGRQQTYETWLAERKDVVTYVNRSMGHRLSPPSGDVGLLPRELRAAICADVPGVYEVDLSWCTMAMMHAVSKSHCFPAAVTDELSKILGDRLAIRAAVGKEHGVKEGTAAQVACGKEKLKFAAAFVSPVLKRGSKLPFRTPSPTTRRVLGATYRFWCCALMLDRYGIPVATHFQSAGTDSTWQPFELLWVTYLYWTRRTPGLRDKQLEDLYSASIAGDVTSRTPFDQVAGYPLEVCLNDTHPAIDLGGRLRHGLGDKLAGDVRWTRCVRFAEQFARWAQLRLAPLETDGKVDTQCDKLGILRLATKVSRQNLRKDPSFSPNTCCLASACSHYISSIESRAVRVVRDAIENDVTFISYLFDGFLVQLRPDCRDSIDELRSACNAKLLSSGFLCEATWDRIGCLPKARRLNRRRERTVSLSDDDGECAPKRRSLEPQGVSTGFDGDSDRSDDDDEAAVGSPTDSDMAFIDDASVGDNPDEGLYARVDRYTAQAQDGEALSEARSESPDRTSMRVSEADILEVVGMMRKWGLKHRAFRERNADNKKDCRVFHQPDPGKAVHVDLFKEEGEAIYTERSNSELVHLIIAEIDPDFYAQKFVDGKNWALEEHFVKWLRRTRNVREFPQRGPSALNPGTIHAFRDGILLLYVFEAIGRSGRSIGSVSVDEVFVRWDDPRLKDVRDPDTGQFPLLCDSRHALEDSATDWLPLWPHIQARRIERCPVILNTMIRQLLGGDFKAFVRDGVNVNGLEDVQRQQLDLMMGLVGGACLAHTSSWGVATILSGPSGTGKTTFWSLVYESLVPGQIAELRDQESGAHGESALRGAHFVSLGELDGAIKVVMPNGKRIISGERVPINPKHKDPEALNTRQFGSKDRSGRDRTAVGNFVGGCTNELEKNRWEEAGWDRRVYILKFGHRVPDNEKDDSLKDAAKTSWGLEVPLCIIAMGKLCRMMSVPGANGKLPTFLDLFPDETGCGLARRQTNAILEVLNTTGDKEVHSDWIKTHLVKKTGRCTDIVQVYQRYKESNVWDPSQKPLSKNEFCDLCTKLRFIEKSDRNHGRIRVCKECEDAGSLSYGMWFAGHKCGGVTRSKFARPNVFEDCEYVDI